MIESKPFKTYNQQLKILRERGLEVPTNGKPKRALEKIGYYTLINGYKPLFLAKDTHGKVIHPERFIPGASFNEILSLYNLDKELRSILYNGLLFYETSLGAQISYYFSERYPERHSYLAMDNFTDDPKKVARVLRTINSLSTVINRSVADHKENAIKHYVNKHRHVPLWVLVDFLTFGDLNYFYGNCTDEVKINIAKNFTQRHKREYSQRKMNSITPDTIEAINHLVNLFRNAVAHNEITYSKYMYKSSKLKSLKSILNLPKLPISDQAGVFELIMSLKVVLDKAEFKKLARDIDRLLDFYKEDFQSVSFIGILQDMHFPENYKEFLTI
ncbi:Abi family protein [Lactobacillus rodentium]|uniref:Abortive infection bacteriophage resistance protein n=1 Tax=Lactobacillus rodentium TaxID=947835 RepID=A0A2Z6T783_9LACO|nr:Abi family protein [Lactobacillus rodentium]MCR1894746.1 Abi family protein [Lactobacillus rodentium]GBG05006.1 abortive infection bacteriophage resistance protein [Lactobacillus rodentium]